MNLFRSDEHATRWLEGRAPGVTLGVATLSDLAHEWWSDRLAPEWRPHTVEQNQGILTGLGLTGPFWELV